MNHSNGVHNTPLQVSDCHIDRMIALTEKELTDQSVQQQAVAVPLREAEELYNGYKRDYETLQQQIDENKNFLESLVRLKSDKLKNGELRVMRATSHLKIKEGKDIRVPWTKVAVEELNKLNEFVTIDRLIDLCISSVGNLVPKEKVRSVKWSMKHNFQQYAQQAAAGKEKRLYDGDTLIEWNKKVGLKSWTTDDLKPKPKYIKAFVHG